MSGLAELGAEFADRFLVAGLLVGEPLAAVGFSVSIAVHRGAGGGEFGSEFGQLGALPGGLGLPSV